MSKISFSKMEVALDEALLKMTRNRLLELANEAKGVPTDDPTLKEHIRLAYWIQFALNQLSKQDKKIYTTLGITKKWLRHLIADPLYVSPEDWEKASKLKEELEKQLKLLPVESNEQLVEQERIQHQTRRFNINKKWLPLK